VIVAMLAGCGWIDTRQRMAVYRPDRRIPAEFKGLAPGDQIYSVGVTSESGEPQLLDLWWLPNPDPRAPALLYLHGTFRNLYYNYPKMLALRDAGFAVLAVEYRGWGGSSTILPSEATLNADAASAWHELVARAPDPARRAIFGHSLGGGVAVELAARLHGPGEFGALIVESSFTSLPDVARSVSSWGYPLAWFATQHFDSIARIAEIHAPILVLHGSDDRTVPIELGRRLFEAASPPKEMVVFAGGSHSDLHSDDAALYRSTLARWAARLRATATGANP
jgi:uncharacterized protein